MYCNCKGHCTTPDFNKKYKTRRIHRDSFKLGYFRCRQCEYYVKGMSYCACCGTRLAIAPRNARSKRKLNAEVVRY